MPGMEVGAGYVGEGYVGGGAEPEGPTGATLSLRPVVGVLSLRLIGGSLTPAPAPWAVPVARPAPTGVLTRRTI